MLQVTVEYKRDPECPGAMIPVRVHTILISTQHDAVVTNEQIRKVSQDPLSTHARLPVPW